ncbi:enoyl-CoA hydratase [Hoyosella sp. G463]|uniref:Enoyl-CoA hydratase n=1 Tax=Lolliginicoccus lacisalsi TaxID=2742202 RepID=A0A927JBF6_9ACTN|nr:enoyl-CoA hydratase [Lolliginicoccus lacisalsi]MBD8505800.1 enoyl-CoA hydratase [Lolliginicoccus lacisalsi]
MLGYSRDQDVVTIELQREDRRNALNTTICTGITEMVREAEETGARAIVLTGRGAAFCAGADLGSAAYDRDFIGSLYAMLHALQHTPLPVIAAVNGPAIGAGVQLTVAADLRVVAEDAYFMVPIAKLGLAMDNWTINRLSELAGGSSARAMLMAAEPLAADQALQCGLANRHGDLAVAQQWAAEIAQLAPLTIRHLKLVFNHTPQSEPTAEQQAAHRAAWASSDVAEARQARMEGRRPTFTGD